MAKKFSIIGNSLVVTDTTTSVIEVETPINDIYFHNARLLDGEILLFKSGDEIVNIPLADAVNSSLVAFTEDSFRSFCRSNLSTSSTSDPTFVADETNVVAVYLKNGTSEAQNVDGSITPVSFSYTPPTGYDFICARIIFYMESSTTMNSHLFGDLPVLTNGWEIKLNGTAALTAKNNRDIVTYMYDVDGDKFFGKTDKVMSGRFSFSKIVGSAYGITIRDGQSFECVVNDDLSTLVFLEAKVMGFLKPV